MITFLHFSYLKATAEPRAVANATVKLDGLQVVGTG